MSRLNKKRVSTAKSVLNPGRQPAIATPKGDEHLNFMGGVSFDVNPLTRLYMMASSCFFGEPTYYGPSDSKPARHYGGAYRAPLNDTNRKYINTVLNSRDEWAWRDMKPAERMIKAIDEALDYDAEATLRFAATLRNDLNIRITPQVIMVRACHHPKVKGTGLVTAFAPSILRRLDEVNTQLAYNIATFGKTLPKPLKRNLARRVQAANPYEMLKYRQEGREVSLVDVVNLTHPKSPLVDQLMKGTLQWSDDRVTWEVLRSQGKSWAEASKVMGHMALLRNLRNIIQDKSMTDELRVKLVATAAKGRQLPFRYLSAFNAVKPLGDAKTLDAIEACLEISIGNLPQFAGRTVSLSDNSGSAHGALTSEMGSMSVAEIGNLMGVLTAKASDEGHLGVFGDRLIMHSIRKRSSVFDVLKTVNENGKKVGAATENGIWLFFRDAILKKQHWDNIFVYSDMQAGHGGLYGTHPAMRAGYGGFAWPQDKRYIDVPQLIKAYRETVNKDVNIFLVQTAGYSDTLVPEFYDRTYILGGWSPEVIRFAGYMNDIRPPKQ